MKDNELQISRSKTKESYDEVVNSNEFTTKT